MTAPAIAATEAGLLTQPPGQTRPADEPYVLNLPGHGH